MVDKTASQGPMRVDTDMVGQLTELLNSGNLSEIEVQDGERRIVVKRQVAAGPAPAPPPAQPAAPARAARARPPAPRPRRAPPRPRRPRGSTRRSPSGSGSRASWSGQIADGRNGLS